MSCIKNTLDSIEFNTTQSIHSRSYPFTITTTNIPYQDGDPVCIKSIDYSYECLGLVLPITYSLCGKEQIFDTDCNSLCNCLEFLPLNLPAAIQADFLTTINTITSTIGIAQSVFSASTVYEKTYNAYRAAVRSGSSQYNAAFTVNQLINAYTDSNTTTLSTILLNLSNGILAFDNAVRYAALLSDSTVFDPTIVDLISGNLYSTIPGAGSSIQYLTTALNDLLALNIPEDAEEAANTALALIPAAINAVNILDNSPSPAWNDIYSAILSVYNVAKYAQLAVYYAADSIGNNVILQFSNSLAYVLFGSIFSFCAANCVNQSISLTGSAQICALDNSAYNSLTSARYDRASLKFTNFDVGNLIPFYRDFKSFISASCCNNTKCLCPNCNDDFNSLFFHQTIYSLHICNLQICISGNIGGNYFKAEASPYNLTSLKELGFNPIISAGTLCIPKCISNFTLRQSFEPKFDVQCISATSNYRAMNGPLLLVDVYSQVDLKSLLTADSNNSPCT